MKKFKTGISEATGIPIEIISDTPKFVLTGKRNLIIENHKGIKSFTETAVEIKTAEGIIYAEGKNISIKEMDKEHIQIEGMLTSFKFEKQE